MVAAARLRDIPKLERNAANLPAVMEAVREALQTLRGHRGDALDQAVTRRDATSGTLARLIVGGAGGGVIIGGPGSGTTPPDLTPPPNPTGLAVSAGISQIYVECDEQLYTQGHGHLVTVVYGAKWPTGDAEPTFSGAVPLYEFSGTFSAYPTDPATRWCIWIKWKSRDGVLSIDPAGGTHGAQATTAYNSALLKTALNGLITETELFATLGARINLIDGTATLPGSVNARVKTETDARVAAILLEEGARITGDATTLAGAQTYTQTWTYNKSTVDTAIAAMGSSVTSAYTIADAGVLTSAQAYVGTYAYSKATIDSSFTALDTSLRADFASADAATLATANAFTYSRATIDGAISSSASTLTASYTSAISAAVATEAGVRATADGLLQAQWTVKLDLNGYVSGFGLASTGGTATPTSAFIIRADSFSIASPTGPGITPVVPFIVMTTPGTVNGVAYPAAVYMDGAHILDLTAPIARMGSLWVDNAMIADLSAGKITAGALQVGAYIRSSGYSSGFAGFNIDSSGTTEFNDIIARGTIYATAGRFSGQILVGASPAISGTTMTGSGAIINTDGTFALGTAAGNITFNGTGRPVLNGLSPPVGAISLVAATFNADSTGLIDSGQSFPSTARVLIEAVDDIANWTTSRTSSDASITTTLSGTYNHVVTVTGMGTAVDSGYVDVTLTRAGYATQGPFRITVSKTKRAAASGLVAGGLYNAYSMTFSPADSSATVEFRSDGSIWRAAPGSSAPGSGTAKVGDWYLPNTTGIGAAYTISFGLVSQTGLSGGLTMSGGVLSATCYARLVTTENAVQQRGRYLWYQIVETAAPSVQSAGNINLTAEVEL